MILFVIAFGLGFVHSFDIDHLCAVASFASNARNAREGRRLGIQWAYGHTFTVVVLGTLLVLFKLAVPAWLDVGAEILVGMTLIILGVWLLRKVMRQLHIHWHEHEGQRHFHIHPHHHGADHTHTHKLTALGVLHGFAGTSGVMLLIPVSLAQSVPAALAYVCVFGLGTILSMALFGAFASRLFTMFQRWNKASNLVQGTMGLVSCVVGVVWIGNCLHLLPH